MGELKTQIPDEEKVLSRAQDYLRDKKSGLNPPLLILNEKEIEVLFRTNRLQREKEEREYTELQKRHALTVMPPWRKRELGFESGQVIYEVQKQRNQKG